MSVRALQYVFEHATSTGNDRVVLLVLADHAHDDGSGAYPAHATIARKAGGISDRTVRDCLRRLEAAGAIERDGKQGRTVVYRLDLESGRSCRNIAADPGDIPADSRTDTGGRPPTNPSEPSEPTNREAPRQNASPPPSLPDAAPRAADPRWQEVLEHIHRVAIAKRAKPYRPQRIEEVCERYPDRDHGAEAEAFEHYWTEGRGENRARSDVVSTWRNWLRGAPSAGQRAARATRARDRTVKPGEDLSTVGEKAKQLAGAGFNLRGGTP